ncbi:MAG: pantetheine-phosphate adenylyltransferase [bacterium]
MIRAVYPGSFDPVTHGHMDIVHRSAAIFDDLILAISNNPSKKALFSIEERLEIANHLTKDIPNVRVDSFDSLLMQYVVSKDVKVVVRGLRAVTDFEMEFQMALINKHIKHDVETIFLVTNTDYSFISSSIIKEVASFGGDVSHLVSPIVNESLKKKFGR